MGMFLVMAAALIYIGLKKDPAPTPTAPPPSQKP